MSKHLSELLNNTFSFILLLVVITVSTVSTLAFNPRFPSKITKSETKSVKGISTLDADSDLFYASRAITYQQPSGVMDRVELQNYEKTNGGYLSRIIISQTQVESIDQNVVIIKNDSIYPKRFKLILRADPKVLQTYLLTAKLNNIFVPVQMTDSGYFETTLLTSPKELYRVGINLNGFGNYINNVGIELEILEF